MLWGLLSYVTSWWRRLRKPLVGRRVRHHAYTRAWTWQTPQQQIRPEEAASQLNEMVLNAEHSVDAVIERDVKGEAACAEADRPEVLELPPIASPVRAVRQALEDALLFPKPEDQPPPPSPPSPRCVAARETTRIWRFR